MDLSKDAGKTATGGKVEKVEKGGLKKKREEKKEEEEGTGVLSLKSNC